ncbi:TPA: DUF4102 domain-containing protein [Escherichia coli]|nr:DUF4102 domain-containing protein [Escherichia coli]
MSLNDSKIRKLKPSSRLVKLSDSHGLYLLVNPGLTDWKCAGNMMSTGV